MNISKEGMAVQNYQLLNKWLYLKNRNLSLKKYLDENRLKTVAVYGLGDIGKRLIEELENDGIQIAYAIDAMASLYFCDFEVYTLQDELPDVDIVMVTVLYDYANIREKMPDKLRDKCVSLETVINGLWERCWIC